MLKKLYNVLSSLCIKRNKSFSGIGLLICDNAENLPISPLYEKPVQIKSVEILEQLLELSDYKNDYHDGFHIMSSHFKMIHISQYIYPNPEKCLPLNASDRQGVRYFSARAISFLPDVKYSAIVSSNYEIHIFKNGNKIDKPI